MKIKQNLNQPKTKNQDDNSKNLTELLNSLIVTTVEKVKGVLRDLAVKKLIHTTINAAKYKF